VVLFLVSLALFYRQIRSMNKRNDISLKGRLLGNLQGAKTTGLISRINPAARFLFFA
jgi:hypothetical protein